MRSYDTIIVGAGPSGMTAALWCARGGQRVLLMDRCERIGRKILVTGNGRCNLTNRRQEPECYRGEDPEKIAGVLSAFDLADTMEFFHRLGIFTRDKDGYVYPYNEQAAAVRDAFESAVLSRERLDVLTETSVTAVRKTAEGFVVTAESFLTEKAGRKEAAERRRESMTRTKKKQTAEKRQGKKGDRQAVNAVRRQFACRSLILASGGMAGIHLGCDGSGYPLAKSLGHHIIKPLPALTALKSSAPFLKKLSGLRNQASAVLLVDGREVCRERGELQWTDYGISGVAVFQMSRFAILALEEGRTVQLSLDFMPEYSAGEVEELLRSCCDDCPYKSLQEMLSGILPAKLAPVILREAGLEADQMNIPLKQWRTEINDILRKISAIIGDFPLRISGYVGYEKAQVTRGGVALSELSGNLESLCCPGLFFAGEVLDVDGTCGGYNLQWAFSSGSVAGQAAWRRNQK